jgi:hypothetical protein
LALVVRTPKLARVFQGSVRALLVLLALVVLLLAAGAVPAAAQVAERPNVLVLMTDDQTADSVGVMPNVQQLLMAQGPRARPSTAAS